MAQTGLGQARWHLQVEDLNGEAVTTVDRDDSPGQVTLKVPAGDYRLSTYRQVCVTSCDELEAPDDFCGVKLIVPRRGAVRVAVKFGQPGEGCQAILES